MWNRLRGMWTVPDLRKKILYTLGMLLIFRIVAYVPVPGIDPANLQSIISKNSNLQQFFGLLDVFSGGSFKNFSVLALGVYPYITASIVVQLLEGIIPRLGELNREGEAGRNRLAQITRYIAVPLAMLQAFSQMAILVNLGAVSNTQFNLFNATTLVPTLATIATLTAGTIFLVWIGELITENGIGNGISLIIFANIVSGLPGVIGNALVSSGSGSGSGVNNGALVTGLFTVGLVLAMIFVMVFVYMAQRRIPVRYPTKRRIFSGFRATEESTYIPMQVNSAGMIPLIFASSILLLPVVIANFVAYSSNKGVAQFFSNVRIFLDSSNWYYWVFYGLLVFAFTYFYAIVMWQQQNTAENLQKQGAFIPGIRPGPRTEDYLYNILKRITFGGALFLGIVAVAPALLSTSQSSQIIQAASLLIVVGVVLDTMKQIEGEMVMRNYSGFLS
ncbi:MAG TPA: preprotein translocase subunit SecY [Ktedonobacterales bacterium]